MQFHNFEEKLLGSKVKIKLIKRLLSDETITSEREIAKLIAVSPGAANRVLKELHECNLIFPLRVGTAITWQLNKQSYAYQFLTSPLEKIKKGPLEELKQDIKNFIEKWNARKSIRKIIVFGSVGIGNEFPNSDVDIFILLKNDRDKEMLFKYLRELESLITQKYGNVVSLNILNLKEYKETRNKRLLENINKGILVMENED